MAHPQFHEYLQKHFWRHIIFLQPFNGNNSPNNDLRTTIRIDIIVLFSKFEKFRSGISHDEICIHNRLHRKKKICPVDFCHHQRRSTRTTFAISNELRTTTRKISTPQLRTSSEPALYGQFPEKKSKSTYSKEKTKNCSSPSSDFGKTQQPQLSIAE